MSPLSRNNKMVKISRSITPPTVPRTFCHHPSTHRCSLFVLAAISMYLWVMWDVQELSPKQRAADPAVVLVDETMLASLAREDKWTKHFVGDRFLQYKAEIENKMRRYREGRRQKFGNKESCRMPLYGGEFGMELIVMVPWAYHTSQDCLIETFGVKGTKYVYFFSDNHTIMEPPQEGIFGFFQSKHRNGRHLPPGNPFNSRSVHVRDFSTERWTPPSFKDFYQRPEVREMLAADGKPLVVINNKFTKEWSRGPVNFFSVDLLEKLLDYLTPKYNVLYKRHVPKELTDHQGGERDRLRDKEMIREKYPTVVLFEDLAYGLQDVEDTNLLNFALMAAADRFLSVQGGNAVVSSYFGGINTILIKKGEELVTGDHKWYTRLSNCSIVDTKNDNEYLELIKRRM